MQDYSADITQFHRDMANKKATVGFTLRDVLIGNILYTVTSYRSDRLKKVHEQVILFCVQTEFGDRQDFLVRHNYYTSDARLQSILSTYFKVMEQTAVTQNIAKLKTSGFMKVEGLEDLELRMAGMTTKDRDHLTTIYSLIYQYDEEVLSKAA